MALLNITNAAWLKFLEDVWQHPSFAGNSVEAFSLTAFDGIASPLTATRAVNWVLKSDSTLVGIPFWNTNEGEGKTIELLLVHHLSAIKGGKEIYGLVGCGNDVKEISIQADCFSRQLGNTLKFKEEMNKEEEKGFWSTKAPSAEEFLAAALDEDTLSGLVGTSEEHNWPTLRTLAKKTGSTLSLKPDVIRVYFDIHLGLNENKKVPSKLCANKLLVHLVTELKLTIENEESKFDMAWVKKHYWHPMCYLWILSQPQLMVDADKVPITFGYVKEPNVRFHLDSIIEKKEKWFIDSLTKPNKEAIEGFDEEAEEKKDSELEKQVDEEGGAKKESVTHTAEIPEITDRIPKKARLSVARKPTAQDEDSSSESLQESEEDDTPTERERNLKRKSRGSTRARIPREKGDPVSESEDEDEDNLFQEDYEKMFDLTGLSKAETIKVKMEIAKLKLEQESAKRSFAMAKRTRYHNKVQARAAADQSKSMSDLNELQVDADARKLKEKSVFKKWDPTNQELLYWLSSKEYKEEKRPKLSNLSKETFLASKNFALAARRLAQCSKSWMYQIIPSGFAQIVASGFYNPIASDAPFEGVSLFWFAPDELIVDLETKQGREQLLKQALANTELSDEAIKILARQEVFLPSADQGYHAVVEMLEATIAFLELYFGEKSIAPCVYQYVLRWIKRNGRQFKRTITSDNEGDWLHRFVHRVDQMFHDFCGKVASYIHEKDPLGSMWEDELYNFPEKEFKEAFGSFHKGHACANLNPMPMMGYAALKSKGTGRERSKGETTRGGGNNANKKPERGGKQGDDGGWRKCPEPCPADWAIPSGKRYNEVHGGEAPENHRTGFPKFKHHVYKEQERVICRRYVLMGSCSFGDKCRQAHIPPSKMPQDKYQEMDKRLKEIYGSL